MSEINRVTFDPGQCGGRPCLRGLRIRVKDILDVMAAGASPDEILADYPLLQAGISSLRWNTRPAKVTIPYYASRDAFPRRRAASQALTRWLAGTAISRSTSPILAALEARRHWLTVEGLPKYAPELNNIEIHLGPVGRPQPRTQDFRHTDQLENGIQNAAVVLNAERQRHV